MIRTTLTATALALGSLAVPAMAEIVPAQCTLYRYQLTTTKHLFHCDFRQSGGNVTVNSNNWAFTFLERNQGSKFIRINTEDAITFTRSGQYSLRVEQDRPLRQPQHPYGQQSWQPTSDGSMSAYE